MSQDSTFPTDLLPPSLAPKSIFFKPHYRAWLCWIVGTCAYVIVVGFGARRPPSVMGFVTSILITGLAVGVFMWVLAGGARRVFQRTVSEANLFFCVGMFAFAVTGMIWQIQSQHTMNAARDEAYAALVEARASRASTRPAATATTTPVNPFRADALAARKQFLSADKYLREKTFAQTSVGLMQEGKPWRWIDKTVENRSPDFKLAYQAWRAAEIKAGTDPKVSDKEFAAIANLSAIRMAVAKYKLKNDRPPTIRNIATLPANPITGQKSVTRSGVATTANGWSYDEYTGRVRIVLPEGNYNGLNKDDIEFVKSAAATAR
jgi:hypothetical protein